MMTLYSLVLWVHVLAVLLLISALNFEALSLVRLARATSSSEAGLWLDLVPGLPGMAIASLLVLLVSGAYLTARMSVWSLGWPKVALAARLLMAPLGAVPGRRIRALRRTIAHQQGAKSAWLAPLHHPFLKFSLYIRFWVVAGIVLLMAAKPDLGESVAIVGASAILGSLWALVGSRGDRRLPAFSTDVLTK